MWLAFRSVLLGELDRRLAEFLWRGVESPLHGFPCSRTLHPSKQFIVLLCQLLHDRVIHKLGWETWTRTMIDGSRGRRIANYTISQMHSFVQLLQIAQIRATENWWSRRDSNSRPSR